MTLPWYYIWSDKYRFFHELLKDSMKDSSLHLHSIEIPQSQFDSEPHTLDGESFSRGSLIKVNTLLKCLEESPNEYIFFTDVDLIVKPGVYDRLKGYLNSNNDMVFLKQESFLNTGLLLLRKCDSVIEFWKMIRDKIIETPGLDRDYVNQQIHSFPGNYTCFNEEFFTCSSTWNNEGDYVILQILSSSIHKDLNIAGKIFTIAQSMDVQPYMKYVKEDVIPYIYEFQEYLFQSYKETTNAVNS